MTEKLHFTYQSIGNICRLFVNIQFEKTKSKRDISVLHQRFDKESDDLFEDFACKLFPEGATIGETEINQLVEYVYRFMQTDEECKGLYAEYDKRNYGSYVYFIPDKKVYEAAFGHHTDIVKNICCDFFKGFKDIDIDYLKKFILENFEIASDFTTVERVANDARFIKECIIFATEFN